MFFYNIVHYYGPPLDSPAPRYDPNDTVMSHRDVPSVNDVHLLAAKHRSSSHKHLDSLLIIIFGANRHMIELAFSINQNDKNIH